MSETVRELLRDVDDTAVEVLDVADRQDAKDTAGSRRDAYEKGLREVREQAGKAYARELAEWIQDEIRANETFPSARAVRKQGAKLVRESGSEVSTGSWLGA